MNGCELCEQIHDEVDRLTEKYNITVAHAGCYMCNAMDDHICKTYNGGCKKIEICKSIKANEGRRDD